MAQINLVQFGAGKVVDINDGETLADVLEREGVDSDAAIRVNGQSVGGADLDIVLVPGQTVVATPPTADHG